MNQVADAEEDELPDSAKAALGHIAGYLAHAATKRGKCKACADVLVARDQASVEVQVTNEGEEENASIFHSFTRILDRGRLLVPSPVAIQVTMVILGIWRLITREPDSQKIIFDCHQPRPVFVDVRKIGKQNPTIRDVKCTDNHRFVETMDRMSRALFNLFAGNMVRDINSEIHAKRGAPAARRTKADDKRRKLSGIKKS